MSYQVLARKWRPKNFQQLMGQEHVVNVLVNALSQKRLHHAYLFTGTRGVGKTTIARIFAKSLNCDTGITDKPCGKCDACIDIDQGRFVDLLEIDAASKTKVDDTREILDNVQYAPSRGRFKVYLIDEVHMLSRHSFNALLKTLEEPPEHVKFILATTDPQKLPITVLSRCLQFHLKALTVKQIEEKLVEILLSEHVTYEQGCLTLLAKAARGSMRDSLSLTDQAIAQGQGNISLVNIQQMLGGIDQNWVYQLVVALLKQDSHVLMGLSQEIASYAPSYSRLFAELIQLFHQIALIQIVEQHFDLPADLLVLLKRFSHAMSAEDVQLYYQISVNGRKDLPYASDEQAAFDMTLLRLLAFKPMQTSQLVTEPSNIIADHNTKISLSDSNMITPSIELSGIDKNKQDTFVESRVEKQLKNELVLDSKLPSEPVAISDDAQQEDLNKQMFAIEQQAAQFTSGEREIINEVVTPQIDNQNNFAADNKAHAQCKVETPPYEHLASPEPQVLGTIDNPVSSVLATRNMLRSRKKALEKQVKKPSDAVLRQSTVIESLKDNVVNKVELPVKVLLEPEVPFHQNNIDPTIITQAKQVDKWANMIDSMQLTARLRQLAINATISDESTDENLILQLNQATQHLNTEFAQQQLQNYISEFLSKKITVTFNIVKETVADPYQIQVQINDKRLEYVKTLLKEDSTVIALQDTFQASINEESISAR
jgi:DNA polymerase-3 subunit gamma/tau